MSKFAYRSAAPASFRDTYLGVIRSFLLEVGRLDACLCVLLSQDHVIVEDKVAPEPVAQPQLPNFGKDQEVPDPSLFGGSFDRP